MVILTRYSLGPGRAAAAPATWPADSRLPRVAGQPTLVMIAHPHCACTRASLGELAVLMAKGTGRLSSVVVFVQPIGSRSTWTDTDLRRSAEKIPGVRVLEDPGGHEASHFGAWTSAPVYYYDASGRLQFCGGITAGRGHSGDNAGRSAIEARLAGQDPGRTSTEVFGCSLFDHSLPAVRR